MSNHWVIDIETLSNLFLMVAKHYKTDEKKVFIIHELKNDLQELKLFLNNCIKNKEWHIGYNIIEFDSQVLHFILDHSFDETYVAEDIYDYAQKVILKKEINESLDYPPYSLRIQQVDLYKLNHWDNAAKRSSLFLGELKSI